MRIQSTICGLLATASIANAAITLDLTSTDSIKQAAGKLAYGMVKYYTGNNTGDVPGNLPAPYYWWEAGAMFSSLIDYWYYTGDSSYNTITTAAMMHQVGNDINFMPMNQTKTLGNDDQAFWGMAAMSAAEANFPNPPSDKPQWLALAQAVFNTQAPRWDNTTCGGGLRWQIFTFNNGYNYKNTISNGCFFNLAARLGRYTGNQTYFLWADTMWDWVQTIGLMDHDYHFFDGSDDTLNCTQMNHIQWTYNAGVFLHGAAVMWNATGNQKWQDRINGIMKGSEVFFDKDVMAEVACESNGKCDVDQRSFKAYLSRWMAATIKLAPFTRSWAWPKLQTSAAAAVKTCNAGQDGNQCGLKWNAGTNDGFMGVGEMMSVLEVVMGNLIDTVPGPVTNSSGGTSKGDYSAGTSSNEHVITYNAISTGDRAGAGIVTSMVLVGLFGGVWWMASTGHK